MPYGKATLPAVLLLAALLPGVSAAESDVALPAGACLDAAAATAAAPPCGYIVPQLALDFPDKPPCKGETLGGPVDLSKCIPMPEKGQSVEQQGTLRWYWDITQDGTYPIDPQEPIVIQFSGTATNPKYMELKVAPESFTLDAAAMASPENTKADASGNKLWFWYERPITVTLARVGDPTEPDLERIEGAGGVQKVFLKAKSNASGPYFKEAFGVEEFRFNAYQDPAIAAASGGPGSQEAPGVGPLAFVAAVSVALGLVLLRRRND